jgi:hypothetical protein
MKNVLWFLLGLIIGLALTYKLIEAYASEAYLKKCIANYEERDRRRDENPQYDEQNIARIPVDSAKLLIANYKKSATYSLGLVKDSIGRSIESWEINFQEVYKLYPDSLIDGLRVYMCEHREKDKKPYNSLVVVGTKLVDGNWVNVFGKVIKKDKDGKEYIEDNVLQYVLPCPDNCNKMAATNLGKEGK